VKSICVYCGSSSGALPEYTQAATITGQLLASQGITLVYGGGNVGLMGAVADAALDAGGRVTGVIPQSLLDRELAHGGLTELIVVESMHQRKLAMADLSDAFIALPGGFGTFEELCEILTWAQLGIHQKPCGLLNVAGYYDLLIAMFDHASQQQFLHNQHRQLLQADTCCKALLTKLQGRV